MPMSLVTVEPFDSLIYPGLAVIVSLVLVTQKCNSVL
jgi:hypothetical protein